MSAFMERAVPRRSPDAQVSLPEEQVSWRLADARLERRERAMRAAADRTGDRRER